jgi:hypothetical protein
MWSIVVNQLFFLQGLNFYLFFFIVDFFAENTTFNLSRILRPLMRHQPGSIIIFMIYLHNSSFSHVPPLVIPI